MLEKPARIPKPGIAQRRPPLISVTRAAAAARQVPEARPLRERLGNQGTQMLVARMATGANARGLASTSPDTAGALSISQPGDPDEREAERVADAVVRTPDPGIRPVRHRPDADTPPSPSVGRVCTNCYDPGTTRVHALNVFDAGNGGQLHRKAGGADLRQGSASVAASIHAMHGSGNPLPEAALAYFEPRFGADFSRVRTHTGQLAQETAESIGARAFTVGADIAFAGGEYAPASPEGKRLLAHELTHVVQQAGDAVHDGRGPDAPRIQREAAGATISSIGPNFARGLDDAALQSKIRQVRAQIQQTPVVDITWQALNDNLIVLEKEVLRRSEDKLRKQKPDVDPKSSAFRNYCSAREELQSQGEPLSEEPEGMLIPNDQLLVADETGQLQLLPAAKVFGIGADLKSMLAALADASDGLPLGNLPGSVQQSAIIWPDGRAVLSRAMHLDLLDMLSLGRPAQYDGIVTVKGLDRPWERAIDAGGAVLRTGVYQLSSYGISQFKGQALPAGSRIRWANPSWRGMETRLFEVFQPGTKKFYAWDAHAPVGNRPHSFYHVNQNGMYNLFGESNHASIPASQLGQAKALRYIKIGGRVFLIVAVLVDSVQMGKALGESIDKGSARPAAAQAVRIIGGWGGAWAGSKAGCAVGGAAGIETGPGLVLTCIVGGAAGAFLGYLGSNAIADLIE